MEPSDFGPRRSGVYVVCCFSGSFRGALYEVQISPAGIVRGRDVNIFNRGFKNLTQPRPAILAGARIKSTCYLLPNILFPENTCDFFHPCSFDTSMSRFPRFESPQEFKLYGFVMSAYGKLYYLCGLSPNHQKFVSFTERYDPKTDSWDSLPPLPFQVTETYNKSIKGYAVFCGCILISLSCLGHYEFLVFHIASQTWREVHVDGQIRDYAFKGRAVIVDHTIYALSSSKGHFGKVISFSFKVDWRILCTLQSPISLSDNISDCESCVMGIASEYLVHMGNLDFCVVHTSFDEEIGVRIPQRLWITTFQVVVGEEDGSGPRIKKMGLWKLCPRFQFRDHSDEPDCYKRFEIKFCFSGECEDFEPGEEQREEESSCDGNNSEDKVVTVVPAVEEHLTALRIDPSGGACDQSESSDKKKKSTRRRRKKPANK